MRVVLIVIVAALVSAPATAARVGPGVGKKLAASRTTEAPTIDGDLRDVCWASAQADDDFTQIFPSDGAPPSMQTVVRVVYDDDNLYVAIEAMDPQPSKVVRRMARRDREVDTDYVELILDSRHDHDSGFVFRVSAAGVLGDYQLHDDTRRNRDWDAVWHGHSKRTSQGWVAELAIPLSILRFEKGSTEWGINVVRYISRLKETVQWVRVPQNENGVASRAGHLTGISDVTPKRTFELRPFVVGKLSAKLPQSGGAGFGEDADRDWDGNVGLDAKIGITSELTLDFTAHPDFGQVEVDEVVLNLSRFEAFFPEKRPFFLESSDLFNTDLNLFYSRRIGATASGLGVGSTVFTENSEYEVESAPTILPIWAAARLTGGIGPNFRIAALNAIVGKETVVANDGSVVSEKLDVAGPRNFAAMRGKYRLGGSTYLGFLATAVSHLKSGDLAVPPADHYAESIDGRYVTPDGAYRVYFHAAASHRIGGSQYASLDPACTPETCEPRRRVDGTTFLPGHFGMAGEFGGGQFGAPNWTFYNRYRFATQRFDANAVGFENNWNYHQYLATGTLREQKPFSVFQNGSVTATSFVERAFNDFAPRSMDLTLSANTVDRNFWSQRLSLDLDAFRTYSIRETFDGARTEKNRGLSLSAGVSSDSRRDVTASLDVIGGKGPRGLWLLGTTAGAGVRVIPAVELSGSASFNYTQNDLRFAGCTASDGRPCSPDSPSRDYLFGNLDSSTLSLTARAIWALSPRLSLQGYLQVFGAMGEWGDYKGLYGITGQYPRLGRKRLQATNFAGDKDGDGLKDDDFAFANLNANIVLRWEPWPGTVFTAVYTRAQGNAAQLLNEQPRLDLGILHDAPTSEVALVKISLFL